MLEILGYSFMQRAVMASVLGGAACGIVGVWVILLGIPFVGVAMSHAAFAGALLGLLLNVNPLFVALLFALFSAGLVGPVAERGDFEPNISVGIIFSLVLGLAFLFMGLIEGPKTEAFKYIWGNILTITTPDVYFLGITTGIIILVLILFYKEILAVLYNREIARAAGIPERPIFYLLLFLCGLTVTLNLNTVGGILIFSLLISPPSAAYQLTYDLKIMYLLSGLFGIISCLLGLYFSYLFNVPAGAVIIVTSSLIFIVCMVLSPKRKVKNHERA
ncbi:MAG: metal ABC transporter permease [Elusimicrobiota bacterium]